MAEQRMTRADRIAGRFLATSFLALMASLTVPGVAQAQGTDAHWLAFSGCWQPVGEVSTGPDASAALLCFQPRAGEAGMEMISVEDGEIVGRETVRADGQPHDAALEGCTGWERGDFSARPGRVFLSSEYLCEGGVARTSTGLLTMVSSEEWIDARVVTAGDESLTWVTRYRLATQGDADAAGLGNIAAARGMAVRSARVAASARPSVEDVIEASGHVDSEAVKAWLVERGAPLDLDSDRLIRMADAGVPEDVIDMAVAVSYPEQFAIEGEPEGYGRGYDSYGGRLGSYGTPYGSLFYGTYGFGYGYGYGYGYGSRYGYGPGLGYGSGYGFGGGYRGPTIVRVVGGGSRDDNGGRVIQGRGYSRGQNGGTITRRAPSSRGSSTGSSARGTSSGRSSGSSASGSSGGSSRGTSTGRTARRRGGGS